MRRSYIASHAQFEVSETCLGVTQTRLASVATAAANSIIIVNYVRVGGAVLHMTAVLQRSENVRSLSSAEVTVSCELLVWVPGTKLLPPALKTCSPQQDYLGFASKGRGSLRRGQAQPVP